ncbi:amidohydrolase [Aequorivita todarodis]|uniref:amidohydrolase n=1 Tax=Aequorivita todarodis TaxID=2036821 RepID=UPI00234FF409|nr:amidohydrolase [Aequorivita todarodis]MDC8002174.1 amidohydrolase [Aequorivita todarodis]
MKTDLKITLVQSELIWENASANRELFSKKFQTFEGETDLIVLPEMFTTGFSMNAKKLAEPNDGDSLNWMISEARKHNCAITGSVIISENDKFYNRLFFVLPDGTYEKYDKKHTFTLAKENETYTAGKERLIVNYKGWKICPLICYDLRFPVWSRNTEDYDVLIYVANWPKVRTVAWDTLLRARAIENMSYCVGVNRVGFDGNDHEYVGHSAVYDVLGKQVSPSAFDEFIETVTLSKEHIESNRKHLQFLNDRDKFTLT